MAVGSGDERAYCFIQPPTFAALSPRRRISIGAICPESSQISSASSQLSPYLHLQTGWSISNTHLVDIEQLRKFGSRPAANSLELSQLESQRRNSVHRVSDNASTQANTFKQFLADCDRLEFDFLKLASLLRLLAASAGERTSQQPKRARRNSQVRKEGLFGYEHPASNPETARPSSMCSRRI